jgi:signal transduction histidine kinase
MAMMAPHSQLRASTEVIPVAHDNDRTAPMIVIDRFVCVVGVDLGVTFSVTVNPLVVGRAGADIELESTDVSRRHARLWRDGADVMLEDLGSSNGTFVNGAPARGAVRLRLGDRIHIGSSILLYTRHDAFEDRLNQLQKLDAMNAMVKGLAHDFNNVLQIVQSGVDELSGRWPIHDSQAEQTLQEMSQATRSAIALVRRLLRIGRNKPPTTEVVEVHKLVDETIAIARRLQLDRIDIAIDVARDAKVTGSREEFRNALLNLIINARDAMPKGGALGITGNITWLDRAKALGYHLSKEGSYVELVVRDTGTGMDEATLARIFEPFFTTKAPDRGTGLGLAMIYSFIRNHNGAIFAESTVGRGTTFRLFLPAG